MNLLSWLNFDLGFFHPDQNNIKRFYRYESEEVDFLTQSLAQTIVEFNVDPGTLNYAIAEYFALIEEMGGFEDEEEED